MTDIEPNRRPAFLCTPEALAAIAILATGLLLQACSPAPLAGPSARIYAADVSGGAKICEVPKVTPGDGQSVNTEIKLGNDGGWCGLPVGQPGRKPFDAGLLSARPAHGSVAIHEVGETTRIDYTPDRGFAGSDSFAVKLIPGNAVIHVGVTVTSPAAAPSTAGTKL